MWDSDQARYDVAQICLNGHVVNSYAVDSPERNQKFCSDCGEQTITNCQSCSAPIRGSYIIPGVIGASDFKKPNYCHECGAMHPWTEKTINAAEELADLIDGLEPEEVAELKNTFPHLIRETPQSQVAAVKFQRFINKGKNEAVAALKELLISVVVDGIKSYLT